INKIRKYVFSNTLKIADWSNSLVISGDAVAEAAKLKAQGGGDPIIYGHGLLGRTVLENDLLDELKIWIHPLFLGQGVSLFQAGAKRKVRLGAAKTLGEGVVVLSYQPVKRS